MASARSAGGADATLATSALAGTTRAFASAAAWPTRRIVSSKIVLAETSRFVEALGAAFGGFALAAGAAPAPAVLLALATFDTTSLTLPTMGSTGLRALVVLAILVAFVALPAFAGLATARPAAVGLRAAVLLRASALCALAVFFFRISTVVVFLSVFLRAAALLFEVSALAVVLALL